MKKIMRVLAGTVLGSALMMNTVNAEEINYQTYFNVQSVSFKETTDQNTNETKIAVLDEHGKELFSTNKINDTVYVNAAAGLNLREVPTIESERKTAYSKGTAIKRVGDSDLGWDIVEVDGEKYFMWDEYLTTEKPVNTSNTFNTVKAKVATKATENSYNTQQSNSGTYSASDLRSMGVINWGGWRWTWYSQRVLPGGGLNIPGRHVDGNGYVCDGNGYICLASGSLAKGTVVNTPFGKAGKVYDSGCAANTLDVYTNF